MEPSYEELQLTVMEDDKDFIVLTHIRKRKRACCVGYHCVSLTATPAAAPRECASGGTI